MISGVSLSFPKDYPVSCLLGCVDVSDVIDRDSYMQQVSAIIIIGRVPRCKIETIWLNLFLGNSFEG